MSRATPTDYEVLADRAGVPSKRPPKAVTTFRVCGDCPSRSDPLNCHRAACPTRTVSLKRVEDANAMMVGDVLNEILGDSAEVEHIRQHLRRHGWANGR
jgi:hypothetical protein